MTWVVGGAMEDREHFANERAYRNHVFAVFSVCFDLLDE